MTKLPDEEHDLGLKRRLMRYLWHLGYLVRKDINLAESLEKKDPYTDIDVLALRIDSELNSEYIVCDCKSSPHAKTRERLFWLSGVMDYFGADQGIFLKSRLFEVKYTELANRVGITPLSEDKLSELEKAYEIDANRWIGAFSDEAISAEQAFALLGKYEPKVVQYVCTEYWNDPSSEQISNLVACARRVLDLRQLSEKGKSFLLAHIFSNLSLSVLQFSQRILTIPSSNVEEYAKLELLGGNLEHEERRRLLAGFYQFMAKEIEERYKSKYPISSSRFIESLVPPYSKYLVELVVRICGNPRYCFLIPRFFDLFAFETVMGNRPVTIQDVLPFPIKQDVNTLLKSVVDFLTFVERSNLLSKDLKELLKQHVPIL